VDTYLGAVVVAHGEARNKKQPIIFFKNHKKYNIIQNLSNLRLGRLDYTLLGDLGNNYRDRRLSLNYLLGDNLLLNGR
jgi:hypothetical protein